jgi:hypothetical protein
METLINSYAWILIQGYLAPIFFVDYVKLKVYFGMQQERFNGNRIYKVLHSKSNVHFRI